MHFDDWASGTSSDDVMGVYAPRAVNPVAAGVPLVASCGETPGRVVKFLPPLDSESSLEKDDEDWATSKVRWFLGR